jgi:hypothetical protein
MNKLNRKPYGLDYSQHPTLADCANREATPMVKNPSRDPWAKCANCGHDYGYHTYRRFERCQAMTASQEICDCTGFVPAAEPAASALEESQELLPSAKLLENLDASPATDKPHGSGGAPDDGY